MSATIRTHPIQPDRQTSSTIGILRRTLARGLAEATQGDDADRTADLDAKLLLAHALGMEPARLTLAEHEAVADTTLASAKSACGTAAPQANQVARLVGEERILGPPLPALSAGTLVPRPETETHRGDGALDTIAARAAPSFEPLRLHDHGTELRLFSSHFSPSCRIDNVLASTGSADAVATSRWECRPPGSQRPAGPSSRWAIGPTESRAPMMQFSPALPT